MKSIIKKLIFILGILIILFSLNAKVFAWSGVIKDGDSFIQAGENYDKLTIEKGQLQDLSGYIYNILLAAGVIIAVIVATILGIQFMIGGAEGQAKVKEMLVPFIVGCIIVFGGFGFWKIAVSIGSRIDNAGSLTTDWSENKCPNPKCDYVGKPVTVVTDTGTITGCPKCHTKMG